MFVGVSDFVQNRLQELGAPPMRTTRVYNAVDIGQLDEKPRIPDEGIVARIGIAGQVWEPKGHEDLIEAARILRERGIRFSISIFGNVEPSFGGRLRERIEGYGLAQAIEWKGFEPDRSKMYRSFDIAVVPSRLEEAFGLAALEPGLCGIPVVCTRVGGLPEVVENGVSGLIVSPASPTELADALQSLLENPAYSRELAANARRRALARFSVDRLASEFESIFENVSGSKNGASIEPLGVKDDRLNGAVAQR